MNVTPFVETVDAIVTNIHEERKFGFALEEAKGRVIYISPNVVDRFGLASGQKVKLAITPPNTEGERWVARSVIVEGQPIEPKDADTADVKALKRRLRLYAGPWAVAREYNGRPTNVELIRKGILSTPRNRISVDDLWEIVSGQGIASIQSFDMDLNWTRRHGYTRFDEVDGTRFVELADTEA